MEEINRDLDGSEDTQRQSGLNFSEKEKMGDLGREDLSSGSANYKVGEEGQEMEEMVGL